MPLHKDDLKRYISNKMIRAFFVIILVSITNCDESSDNKYINKLPNTDRKVFLDKVARRILEEVPDVKSIETSAADGGDVLEAKLKAQSDFVQNILNQEVDSLKAKRKNNASIKKTNKESNETDLVLDTQGSTSLNQSVFAVLNNTRKADTEETSVSNNNNITTTTSVEVTEHIDLTFRAHESVEDANKRKGEHYEQFVPVKVKYDEVEILNGQEKTNKGGNRKREIMPESKVSEASTVPAKNKTRRRSDNTGYLSSTVTVNTTTSDAKVNNNEVLDLFTTSTLVEEATETTTETIKVVSETQTESTIKAEIVTKATTKINIPKSPLRNQSNESESSEFLGENISVENKSDIKKTTPTDQNKTTTRESNLNIINLPTSEDLKDELTSITSLTTTEASTLTSANLKATSEKNALMTNADDANNKTANSTAKVEPATTTEILIGLTITPKKCDEKPCNKSNQNNKTEEKHEETVTTVSTSKRFEATTVTNAADASINSTSPKIIKKLKSALRGLKNKVSKHSPSHMHYGDLQVPNAYEVFEVDPDKPAFIPQKPFTERAHKVPVYIYDKEHAFYNAHNRYESDPIVIKHPDVIGLSSISETIEESLEGIIMHPFKQTDGKRMIKIVHDLDRKPQTHAPYRVRPRLEQLPNTHEEEHPFQIHKRGLKDSLKAVRGILYTNSMFGYVPTNHEREVSLNSTCIYAPHNFHEDLLEKLKMSGKGLRCDDVEAQRKQNIEDQWNNAREDTSGQTHQNHNDESYNSVMDFLKRYMKRPKKITKLDKDSSIQNISYDIYRNTVTIDGVTYSLYDDDKLESLIGTKEASSRASDEDDKVNNWVRTLKYKKKNKTHKESVIINKHNRLAEVLKALQTANKWKSSEVSSEELNYLKSINKPKSSSDETSYEGKEPRTAIIQQKLPAQLKRKVKSYSNKKLNRKERLRDRLPSQITKKNHLRFDATDGNFGKLDTIEKISVISPAIDLIENIEQMLEKKIKIKRTDDEDLELHLNILKDLVKMDNTGLKRFDWLGSTVDIQAALRKLMDLTEKKIHHRHIHPNDLNLLQYIQELYKKAKDVLFQREDENRINREEASRALDDRPSKHARTFPKNGKTISNPLKVLDHIWDLMNDQSGIHADIFKKIHKRLGRIHTPLTDDDEFLIFLYTIRIRLENFHEAIKQIASITTYDSQHWYKNIKDLFLNRAGKKEYLEVLLHLFLTRFLDLMEENVMMGANKDFKQFMGSMRAEVDRTEVELVFILKILKEIKQYK